MRIAVATLLVGAGVAAAILLNLALLGYSQPRHDPVGKLSPRAIFQPGSVPARPTLPAVTTVTVGEADD